MDIELTDVVLVFSILAIIGFLIVFAAIMTVFRNLSERIDLSLRQIHETDMALVKINRFLGEPTSPRQEPLKDSR